MEKEEFKRVWLPLSDDFYRMAFVMLGSEADAKDAVQDLYIRLWNLRSRLGDIRSPRAYGVRLVRNICIDRLRSRSARGRHEDIAGLPEASLGEEIIQGEADRPVIGRETVSRLMKAVSELPSSQRTVVEMRFFRQMDYDEIVACTGLSAVNVRVLVNRARKSILSAMKEYM